MENDLLRHFVDTIRYRATKVLDEAPVDFSTFDVGSGVRTPLEILTHVGDVLTFALFRLRDEELDRSRDSTQTSWETQLERFNEVLASLDEEIRSGDKRDADLDERLLQGPFADVMTHIGQMAMLKRMAGSPVSGENFFAADIYTF